MFKSLKKVVILCFGIVLMFALSSCKSNTEQYSVVNQTNPETAQTAMPVQEPTTENTENTSGFSENNLGFNPLAEEDEPNYIENDDVHDAGVDISDGALANYEEDGENTNIFENHDEGIVVDPSSASNYSGNIKYAGATPIPILPIDIPTPTPKAALQFNYQEYQVNMLNLKFQAPTGWEVDESQQDTYILNEPIANQKDNFSANIVIRALPLSKEYTAPDLQREMKSQLEQIGLLNYTKWSASKVAKRNMLGGKGLYANYKGTLTNGVKIRGRLQMVAIGKTLYSVQMTFPANYGNDFITVFSKIRHSLSFINKP